MDELTAFGVRLEDDGPHPFDPTVEWWNESWFWDWVDPDGEIAGHCRIGLHPVQQRAWIWLYLYRRGEWIVIDEPRLPYAEIDVPRLRYDRFGLRFSWDVAQRLRRGHLRVEGFGRVLAGPRRGWIVPVGVDLEVTTVGPAHGIGRSTTPGHGSDTYEASRFEQPISLDGRIRFADQELPFTGRGERDHSWGPRFWNIEWTFVAVGSDDLRLQCAEARVPNAGRFALGYVLRERMTAISDVEFDFHFDDDSLERPVSGAFRVRLDDDTSFRGTLETISAAEIDITHTFVPPCRSIYRRALIRVHRDDGGAPLLGWTEFNYFPGGPPH
jgi:hypothetical protein